MECKNETVYVEGIVLAEGYGLFRDITLRVICTNDKKGKTLSIDNGRIQFSIPFEPIEKYFK